MEPLYDDKITSGKPGKSPSRAGMFIVLLMAILALMITVFWGRGAYAWWKQHRVVSNSVPVVGKIEDIRFIRESVNKKYCVYELTYSYRNEVSPMRSTFEVPVPGSKDAQQAGSFSKGGRRYKVGDEISILVSKGGTGSSMPADFVVPFRSHMNLGIAIAVLWILFAFRVRRLIKTNR